MNFDIEFWSEETEHKFERACKALMNAGFTEEEAKEFLEDLYFTVAGEYGD